MHDYGVAQLLSITLFLTIASLLVGTLVIFGFPMAGAGSALVAAGGATALTLSLAYIFAHGAKGSH